MSLKARLQAEIAQTGPISIADYVLRCLHDPLDGYYATRPAIGEDGDFVTAPAVSQMFGELIGLWLIETWRAMGAPDPFVLAEAGPGDGTLMADIARTARLVPAFRAAARVWLVETSVPLRALQTERLARAWPGLQWAETLAALPSDTPLLLVANEFLDCLPARQFVRTERGWAERIVGLDGEGALALGLRPAPEFQGSVTAGLGAIVEHSAAQAAFAAHLAERLVRQGGAALLIDYGRAAPDCGDTLQALAGHRKCDPLDDPGAADLTQHADFPAVLAAARAAGASAALLTQGEFLGRLGIGQRAAALAQANPARTDQIGRQLRRLIDADEMGQLFKAAALWSGAAPPPGFDAP